MNVEAGAGALADSGRWVLLLHETPADSTRATHFDLMLETATGLATWACDVDLFQAGAAKAQPLADHRKAYLEYEGEISNNRGSVRRIVAGEFTTESIRGEVWTVRINGDQTGRLVIPVDNNSEIEIRFQNER